MASFVLAPFLGEAEDSRNASHFDPFPRFLPDLINKIMTRTMIAKKVIFPKAFPSA